jgi:16S rRNA (guanine966-N2)-methyltransferase
MTRIIGGVVGGRRIKAPTGDATRPTSDRVREALFSSVDATVGSLAGLRFLDLYAGSGAVGLEARSRGAGVVTCIEQNRRTATLIRDNARALGLHRVEVVAAPVSRALLQPPRAPYDVVFLDPPYSLASDDVLDALAALRDHHWLTSGALVAVERSSRDAPLAWPDGFVPERLRRYGETTLWYGRASAPE